MAKGPNTRFAAKSTPVKKPHPPATSNTHSSSTKPTKIVKSTKTKKSRTGRTANQLGSRAGNLTGDAIATYTDATAATETESAPKESVHIDLTESDNEDPSQVPATTLTAANGRAATTFAATASTAEAQSETVQSALYAFDRTSSNDECRNDISDAVPSRATASAATTSTTATVTYGANTGTEHNREDTVHSPGISNGADKGKNLGHSLGATGVAASAASSSTSSSIVRKRNAEFGTVGALTEAEQDNFIATSPELKNLFNDLSKVLKVRKLPQGPFILIPEVLIAYKREELFKIKGGDIVLAETKFLASTVYLPAIVIFELTAWWPRRIWKKSIQFLHNDETCPLRRWMMVPMFVRSRMMLDKFLRPIGPVVPAYTPVVIDLMSDAEDADDDSDSDDGVATFCRVCEEPFIPSTVDQMRDEYCGCSPKLSVQEGEKVKEQRQELEEHGEAREEEEQLEEEGHGEDDDIDNL